MKLQGQHYHLLYAILLISLSLSCISTAKASQTQPYTLSEAIKTAISRNPQLHAARQKVDASQAQIQLARSGFFPQIDVVETFNRTTNPMWAFGTKLNQKRIGMADFDPGLLNDPDEGDNFITALSVKVPLYQGGRIVTGYEQAQLNHTSESLAVLRTKQNIIANTAIAYVGMLLAREYLTVIKQAIASAHANQKLVKSRFDSGFAVKSDLLRAQVRIAELEQERIQAESKHLVAQAMLNAVMGIAEDTVIEPATPFETCSEINGNLDAWIDKALKTRPELKQLDQQKQMAEKQIRIARAGHLPTLSAFYTYELNSEDFSDHENNYTVGAMLQLNLFSGFGISARQKMAQASLREVEAMKKSMTLGVKVQTREAFLYARSAWQRIQVAKSVLAQSDEGVRIVKNRYQSGLLTIVSLLDAEVADQQAKTSHFKALHDYKVARIKLELSAGTLDETFQ